MSPSQRPFLWALGSRPDRRADRAGRTEVRTHSDLLPRTISRRECFLGIHGRVEPLEEGLGPEPGEGRAGRFGRGVDLRLGGSRSVAMSMAVSASSQRKPMSRQPRDACRYRPSASTGRPSRAARPARMLARWSSAVRPCRPLASNSARSSCAPAASPAQSAARAADARLQLRAVLTRSPMGFQAARAAASSPAAKAIAARALSRSISFCGSDLRDVEPLDLREHVPDRFAAARRERLWPGAAAHP